MRPQMMEVGSGSGARARVPGRLSCPVRIAAIAAAGLAMIVALPATAAVAAALRPALGTISNGWNAGTLPAATPELYGVSCPSSTVCVAVSASYSSGGTSSAAAVYSTNGGQTWAASSIPSGIPALYNVSCPASSFCMAVASPSSGDTSGNAALVSTDGGKTWKAVAAPPGNSTGAFSLFCASSADCWVGTGDAVDRTTNGGVSWAQAVLVPITGAGIYPGPVSGLWFADANHGWATAYDQCGGPGVRNCGGVVATTADGGATWTLVLNKGVNSSLGTPVALSCTSTTSCLVLGANASGALLDRTTDGGKTWTSSRLAAGPDTALIGVADEGGLTCDGTSNCYVTGWNGGTGGSDQPYTNASSVVLASTDGGATWHPTPTAIGVAAGYAVSCVPGAPGSCAVVGLSAALTSGNAVQGAVEVTPDGGTLPDVTAVSPSSGPLAGGESVTITGSDLTGGAVTFGSIPATGVTVVSSSEITATVPPALSAGVVNVQVTNTDGTSPAYDDATQQSLGPDGFLYVTAGAYNPLTPYRICDTRSGNSTVCSGANFGPGGEFCLGVAGTNPPSQTSGGVPSTGAEAVVLNVTAIDLLPVAHGGYPGYVTVSPGGVAAPLASNLNYVGAARPNLVEVALGFLGVVCLFNAPTGEDTNIVVDVEGWVAGSSTGSGYTPANPTRICDTRPGNPSGLSGGAAQCAGKTLAANATLPVKVAGVGPVPSGAVAAVLNVTMTNTTSGGYLTVWPGGQAQPLASNLNWSANQTVANRVIVPIGTGGTVDVFNSAGSSDLIADVGGYFASSGGLLFTPSSPTRICDTRSGSTTGCAGKTLGPGKTLDVAVGGVGGVPSGASALVANVTVADTTSGGYLTVWPEGQAQPTASDVNWGARQVVPNLVVVKLGSTGGVAVFASRGSTDVIIDVAGWYST